jgi:serine/threonine protein kinase
MALSVGARLGPYEIDYRLGAGGMGEVYRARDTRLDRPVAIKIISAVLASDSQWRDRFDREARAISRLNHPNICTVHDVGCGEFPVGSGNRFDYLVLEYLEGETLAQRTRERRLEADEILGVATDIVDALAEAHRHDLVHRDIKPHNIFLTRRGGAKILDFGLAKLSVTADVSAATTAGGMTDGGVIVGTLAYMSPEQLRGEAVDARSDLFSFGVLLYELVVGDRPFTGDSTIAVADAILHAQPREFGDSSIARQLKPLILRLLAKDRAARSIDADDVARELKRIRSSRASTRSRASKVLRVAVPVVIAIIVFGTAWMWRRSSRERWALQVGPEIARLIDAEEYVQAAALARDARAIVPNDPTLEQLWKRATGEVSITTSPAGADVSFRPYDGQWQSLGTTPLDKVPVARSDFLWRIAKPGFAPIVFFATPGSGSRDNPLPLKTTLRAEQTVRAGMVPVVGAQTVLDWPFGRAAEQHVDDFLIDRLEVTNEEFKKFVDAGGYQRHEYWVEPFTRDGRVIPWEEGVAPFRDATGRPGPATWQVGSFLNGTEKHPVGGVSWYEAAAYARFAGKSLPTVYHWKRAAQNDRAKDVVPGSNFSEKGTVPVGGSRALSGFGTSDMAGNVKEWTLNESTGGRRFILGGGFGEANFMFTFMDTQSPWDRRPNLGFRCVMLMSPPSAALTARLEHVSRDVWQDAIVSDEVVTAFKTLYAYDRSELHPRVDATQDGPDWTRQQVTFEAAYGGERVIAHVFLPKRGKPPFQTIIYFPGAEAVLSDRFLDRFNTSSRIGQDRDFFVRSGRAFVVPIYKGTFERRDGLKGGGPTGNPPALWRDHVIMFSKDLGRTLDYLEARPDIDRTKFGFFGFSFGSGAAPVLWAVEPRIKVAVLTSGGFWSDRALPEADGTNFVTRIKIPVLMLNGRYDSNFPVETAQLPLFRRLGTPEHDKRHVLYDGGHGALPRGEEVRETLDWFDKYLGPVRP